MNKSERERRKWLRGLLLAAGSLGLPGMIRQVLAAGEKPVREGVVSLNGTLQVNGQQAQPGSLITVPARIETGAASQAVFVVGRDAFLLHAGTQVEMRHDSDGVQVMRVLAGRILSVFAKGPKRVITSTAVIGIRGTGMYLDVMPQQTYFCLCYGEADLQAGGDMQQYEHIQTTHHDSPRMIFAHGEQMIAKERVKGHTDDELIMLEALVGRVPPFVTTWATGNRY